MCTPSSFFEHTSYPPPPSNILLIDHHHPIPTDDDNVYLVDDPEDDVWSWLWPYLNTTQVKKKEKEEGRKEGR